MHYVIGHLDCTKTDQLLSHKQTYIQFKNKLHTYSFDTRTHLVAFCLCSHQWTFLLLQAWHGCIHMVLARFHTKRLLYTLPSGF